MSNRPLTPALLVLPLMGQEADGPKLEDLLRLRNTPVTVASRREQPFLEAPQAIEIITRAQIEEMGAFRLGEVLLQALSLSLLSQDPQNTYVGIRGNLSEGYPKNVQVLIDGVPFNNALRGAIDLDNLPVPLAMIERIEIVRGPASALYGAGAVGGAIAIHTMKAGPRSFAARAGQSDRRRDYAAQGSLERGAFGLTLGFDGASAGASGYPYRPLGNVNPFFQPTPTQAEQLKADGFHQSRGFLRGSYTQGATQVSLLGGRSAKHTGANFGSGFVIPYEQADNHFAEATWKQQWAPGLETEASVHTLSIQFGTGDFTKPESRLIDYTSRQAAVQITAEPTAALHLVAGWDARNSVSSSILGPVKGARDHAWGIFLIADWKFAKAWEASLGGRYEQDTLGGDRFAPRAVLSFRPNPDQAFRLGYSTSVRSPQVLEARISATTPSRIIPNPSLSSETTASLELGYRQEWDSWIVDATAFHMTYEDLIARKTVLPTPAPSGTRQYINVGEARGKGLEWMVQKRVGGLVVGLNATHMTLVDQDGQDFVYTPRSLVNLFLRFRAGEVTGFAGLQHQGAHRIGNYLGTPTFEEVGSRLRGRFNLNYRFTSHLTASVYGTNLGGASDGQGAGGTLQSPILRGTQQAFGLALAVTW